MTISRVHIWLAAAIVSAVALTNDSVALAQFPRLQRLFGRFEEPVETAPQIPDVDGLAPWLKRLHELVPYTAEGFAELNFDELNQSSDAVEKWCAQWGRIATGQPPQMQLDIVGRLHDVRDSVDRQLDNLFNLRAEFAGIPDDARRREAIRGYLRTTSTFIDLSGRLRYLLVDVINGTTNRLADNPQAQSNLIRLLTEKRSGVGAEVMAARYLDPNAAGREDRRPVSAGQKVRIINLVSLAGSTDEIDELARFALDARTPAPQVLAAAEAIRHLGLPQDPRPDQDSTLPQAPVTASQLHDRLLKIEPTRLQLPENSRLDALIGWLADRAATGLNETSYRVGQIEVRPGDWLLMRNPSPYNLFTDLSPGLFTHVGVAALETGSDGKRRMVIVDLPERGTSMPATNVDTFLDRTRHFVFVRHNDPAAGQKMGQVAASLIGNPTEFDLNFRTDRLAELKGKPLVGKKIHTYCAGFLLLCGQETGLPCETFFPITEATAPGKTKDNLAQLGLSLGEGFVSPTGALFSPALTIVGRREPMYDARREIEEAVFDHFALCMREKELRPSPNAFQAMRLKMAEASTTNPLLAKALAAAAGVSENMDLVAAAKAAAIVETLDEIATGASSDYLAARQAIMQGPPANPVQQASGEQNDAEKLRTRHTSLAARWSEQRLSPRELRVELVKYYSDIGRQQIDQRFFGDEPITLPSPARGESSANGG